MKSAGFNFTKNNFRYAILEIEDGMPKIVEKDKVIYPDMDTASLMEWLETQLSLIIDKHQPVNVAYRISLTINTIAQMKISCYAQAILNLVAKKKSIEITSFSSQAINATKFGQPRKTDVYEYMDGIIGEHKPYWNKETKDAVLVAWFNLL